MTVLRCAAAGGYPSNTVAIVEESACLVARLVRCEFGHGSGRFVHCMATLSRLVATGSLFGWCVLRGSGRTSWCLRMSGREVTATSVDTGGAVVASAGEGRTA